MATTYRKVYKSVTTQQEDRIITPGNTLSGTKAVQNPVW